MDWLCSEIKKNKGSKDGIFMVIIAYVLLLMILLVDSKIYYIANSSMYYSYKLSYGCETQ